MTLTDAEIDAIEQRANAATPGPWERVHRPHRGMERDVVIHRRPAMPGTWEHEQGREVIDYLFVMPAASLAWRNGYANLHFAAHAREDIPALIAALREARAALTGMPIPALQSHENRPPAENPSPDT